MTNLRFGIRDLLWAMVVVGLAIGWWADRERWRSTVAEAEARRTSAELNLMISEAQSRALEQAFMQQHPERVGTDFEFDVEQ